MYDIPSHHGLREVLMTHDPAKRRLEAIYIMQDGLERKTA
jgi:hypothetical protein